MSLLIPGTNSIKDTGYDVANSCRFEDASDDYLSRSVSSSGNRRTWTWSAWVKRSNISQQYQNMMSMGSNNIRINFSNQNIWVYDYNGSGFDFYLVTNSLYRDISAWMHIVVAVDTTQGTASNRVKLYINGVQETSFSTETYPSLNHDTEANTSGQNNVIGTAGDSLGNNGFHGYMAEIVLIDGQALAADQFGEFDSDSPNIWKPIDVSGLTFGTNGFYLDFEDSSALGNDVSGNNNDFTVNNLTAIDQTTDTCTNNFCTLNPLINSGGNFSNGNCQLDGGTDNKFVWATMATSMNNSSAGWYYEVKVEHTPDSTNGLGIRAGCGSIDFANSQSGGMGTDGGWAMSADTAKLIQNSAAKITLSDNGGTNSQASGVDVANGQILNVAWKNGKCFFGVNGTYIAADGGSDGNPASDSNQSHDVASSVQGDFWNPIFASSGTAPSFVATIGVNFGNPTFSISSGNADANGYGNFEYAPPTGFYAICSKNLAEYG